MRIRKNVNELKDDTLLWYSKAVVAMKRKDINDPTSWWYQGAIHGFGLSKAENLAPGKSWSEYSVWQQALGFPPDPKLVDSQFWQQCQHGTWYFLPWHRMYLQYFEQIVADTVVELGGPQDWTLPYWNYCDANNPSLTPEQQLQALALPPEFGGATPVPEFSGLWIEERGHYQVTDREDASCEDAMALEYFTTAIAMKSFGGVKTSFSHDSGTFGKLENNPHNLIHVDISGAMGDPNTAALDPIFWLHHANIDRLWQCWIEQGRENTSDAAWLEQSFDFHDAQANPVRVKVKEVLSTEPLGYTYSNNYPSVGQEKATVENMSLLTSTKVENMLDTIAATTKPLKLETNAVVAELEFLPKEQQVAKTSNLSAFAQQETSLVMITLDNVTGSGVVSPVSVFVRSSANEQRVLVGKVGLFGLTQASTPSIRNAGTGISVELDATKAISQLTAGADWQLEHLQIEVEPSRELGNAEVNVGRVSVRVEV